MQCLFRLQQVLVDVQKVNLQLFQTDLHIGRLQHIICKSGLQEIPPVVVRSNRNVAEVGGEFSSIIFCLFNLLPFAVFSGNSSSHRRHIITGILD